MKTDKNNCCHIYLGIIAAMALSILASILTFNYKEDAKLKAQELREDRTMNCKRLASCLHMDGDVTVLDHQPPTAYVNNTNTSYSLSDKLTGCFIATKKVPFPVWYFFPADKEDKEFLGAARNGCEIARIRGADFSGEDKKWDKIGNGIRNELR